MLGSKGELSPAQVSAYLEGKGSPRPGLLVSKEVAMRSLSLAIWMLLLSWGEVGATTYYVWVNGSNSNSGTSWGQAFKTIQKAIDSASNGDDILVGYDPEGSTTYNITSQINVNKSVRLTSARYNQDNSYDSAQYDRDKCIIDAGGNCRVLKVAVGGVTIRGFTIRNGETSWNGGGIYVKNTTNRVFIINNIIKNNKSYNCGGGIYANDVVITIQGNTISGNEALKNPLGAEGYEGPFGGGIYVRGHWDSNSFVTDNIITNNIASIEDVSGFGGGICCGGYTTTVTGNIIKDNKVTSGPSNIYTNGFGGGIYVEAPSYKLVIKNNTFYRNRVGRGDSKRGSALYVSDEHHDIEVRNNIFYDHDEPDKYVVYSEIPITIKNNCFYRYPDEQHKYNSDKVTSQNELDADPKVENTTDFTLQYDSPCIEAGYKSYSYDEDENHDKGWKEDIGAKEYTGTRVKRYISSSDVGNELLFGGQVRAKIKLNSGTNVGRDAYIDITVHPDTAHPEGSESVKRYYTITAYNITDPDFDITLSYKDAELNGEDENKLTLFRWDGSRWHDSKISSTTRDADNNWVKTEHETSFSDWIIDCPYEGSRWYVYPSGVNCRRFGSSWDEPVKTIKFAVNEAPENAEILVGYDPSGTTTYNITSQIEINKPMKLTSAKYNQDTSYDGAHPDRERCIIDANYHCRVFYVNAEATIRGFTIREGAANTNGGGIYLDSNASNSLITNNIIKNNRATTSWEAGCGGGIWCNLNASNVQITDNIIENNKASPSNATGYGGGIYCGSVTLTGNTISNNVASKSGSGYGGGIYYKGDGLIQNNVISGNTGGGADGYGGGIYVYPGHHPTITHNIIRDNKASSSSSHRGWGGGIYLNRVSETTLIKNNVFYHNEAGGGSESQGGAIYSYNYDTSLNPGQMRNNIFYNYNENGIYVIYSRFKDVTIRNNCFYSYPSGYKYNDKVTSEGEVDEDPRVENTTDFTLRYDSPCIDAGYDESGEYDKGWKEDIGIDEYAEEHVRRYVTPSDIGKELLFGGQVRAKIKLNSGTSIGDDAYMDIVVHPGTTHSNAPNSVKRYYTITSSGLSNLSFDIVLSYKDSELNNEDENKIRSYRWTSGHWASANFSERNTSQNWVKSVNETSFSDWILDYRVYNGTVWYVYPTGSDEEDRGDTWYTPCKTIGYVVGRAPDNSEILVGYDPSGSTTYNITSQIEVNRRLKITSARYKQDNSYDTAQPDRDKCIISAGQNCRVFYVSKESTIRGFTIKSGKADNGGGVYLTAYKKLTLLDNLISDNQATDRGGGVYAGSNSILTLRGNIFKNNSATNSGGAVYMMATGSFRNNIFDSNSDKALYTTKQLQPGDIRNNIFLNNSGYALYSSIGITVKNNCFYNNGVNYNSDVTSVDELLVDPKLNSDYTLQCDSPCIEAGYDTYSYDEEENHDKGWKADIGAKEYTGTEVKKYITQSDIGKELLFGGQVRAKIKLTSASIGTGAYVDIVVHPSQSYTGLSNTVKRYYTITGYNITNPDFEITLSYKDGELNGNEEGKMEIYRKEGSQWKWAEYVENDSDKNWIKGKGDSFSDWIISQPGHSGSVWYLYTSGEDELNSGGGWSSPCKSFKYALRHCGELLVGYDPSDSTTYNITSQIEITKPVKITSARYGSSQDNSYDNAQADSGRCIIDANYQSRIWYISGSSLNTSNTKIRGFTVRRGDGGSLGGGFYICGGASPEIRDNVIEQCYGNRTGQGKGGGIYCSQGTSPLIEGNTIRENVGGISGENNQGGGICVDEQASPTIRDNQIISNYAGKKEGSGTAGGWGGGISTGGGTIEDNEITGNIATDDPSGEGYGGGIYMTENPVVRGNVIKDNVANGSSSYGNGKGYGGGVYVYLPGSSPNFQVANNTFIGNKVSSVAMLGDGNGLYFTSDDVAIGNRIRNNIFKDHNAWDKYCVYSEDTYIEIFNNCFYNNSQKCNNKVVSSNEIDADPKLNSDYTLQSDSPCIDAGKNEHQYNASNHDKGWKEDIGAKEYTGTCVKRYITSSDIGKELLFGGQVRAKIKLNSATIGDGAYIEITVHPNTCHSKAPKAVKRYFTITSHNITDLNFDIMLSYKDSELNGESEGSLGLYRWDGVSWHGPLTSQRSLEENWVKAEGQTSFSDWTFDSDNSLPVLFSLLEGRYSFGRVVLRWRLGGDLREVNGFRVWRRKGGEDRCVSGGEVLRYEGEREYIWVDKVGIGGVYRYRIEVVKVDGSIFSDGVEVKVVKPEEYRLLGLYPNPFNRFVVVRYCVPERVGVRFEIYDVGGRLVRVLDDREVGPGEYVVKWDGRDGRGVDVGSGVYFCVMRAGSFREVKKMVLVR